MQPTELGRATFDAAELIRDHPPRFTQDHKRRLLAENRMTDIYDDPLSESEAASISGFDGALGRCGRTGTRVR